ncbi:MAG: Fic family protein [Gammaproteobacteria bacterium]|nr:Fic family protein [Gammaproteobacteria bacterium]
MIYFWQTDDWPNFTYGLDDSCEKNLYAFAERMGRTSGLLEGLDSKDRMDALVWLLMEEAIKTSEIEGEYLSREDVISSIRNNLGLNTIPEFVRDRRAEGVVALTMTVRDEYAEPLCKAMLLEWHRKLMNWDRRLRVGGWRNHKEPMQIISGPIGKEKVHFEAPPSSRIPQEMKKFIQWFNSTAPGEVNEIGPAPLRSALAHLYFESIHPFEDGNGRIGRALSEKALSQGIDQPVIMSLSKTIEANKKSYYEELKSAQRKQDVSSWILFFSGICLKAQNQAERQIQFTLRKSKFLDRLAGKMNERQTRVVQRMLEEGPDGFEGGMNARKYISITKTSKATATRDMRRLLEMGVFEVEGGGRSTRYALAL